MAASTLIVMQFTEGATGESVARTMGLIAFALAGIFLALEINDEFGSVFSSATLGNRQADADGLYSLLATIAVTEIGLFQRIFDTESLSVTQWLVCAAVGSAVLWVMEIYKFFHRRGSRREVAAAPVAASSASA